MEKQLIELFEKVDGNKDKMMSKDELKVRKAKLISAYKNIQDALKRLCETVDSKSPLFFVLSDINLSESNLGKFLRFVVLTAAGKVTN